VNWNVWETAMTTTFGLALPTHVTRRPGPGEAGRLRDLATRAESLGFDGLWVAEHLLRAPLIYDVSFLSPLGVLAHVAACTRTIRVGTAVLVLPLRQPVVLAKELATLDFLSGGRLVLGVGTGWDADEFAACAVPLVERGPRTDEALALLRRLLTEEKVTFDGRFHHVHDVTIDPRPARALEVWLGGGSKIGDPASADKPRMARSVLERIRREADVWVARPTDQALILADLAQVRRACADRGRPLGLAHFNFVHVVETDDRAVALAAQRIEFERVMGTHRPFAAVEASYLLGTATDIRAKLGRLVEAGFTHFILGPLTTDREQLELIHDEIVRPLADGAREGKEHRDAHAG
jgi:probable F420-dependent oxidoreductase